MSGPIATLKGSRYKGRATWRNACASASRIARNHLFHNEGQGKFADVSEASGIARIRGCCGFTVVASDFDNDGYPDFYVACDSRLHFGLGDSAAYDRILS